MSSPIYERAVVGVQQAGKRLDQIAVELFPQFSRARLQTWIKSGELTVNGQSLKQTARLHGGEDVQISSELQEEGEWLPEHIELDIQFEDAHLLVLNKPAGLVVHPAAGNWQGTLLNGLLGYHSCFAQLPRAGIVHRLDKDTSGLMVVAKSLEAQNDLVKQLQARTVKRQYRAFSIGGPDSNESIDAPIGRHPSMRTKMAVLKHGGKEALTHVKVAAKWGLFRNLELKLETGRTHQIRVHLAWRGFPLIGDPVYGKKLPGKVALGEALRQQVEGFPRQALHAERLALKHPVSAEQLEWHCAIPDDMQALEAAIQSEGNPGAIKV